MSCSSNEMKGTPHVAEACIATFGPTSRCLFMSGYTEDAILHHRVLAPGIALLQKPLTPETLKAPARFPSCWPDPTTSLITSEPAWLLEPKALARFLRC